MKKAFEMAGNLAAILGVALSGVSGGARVTGAHYLAGYESMTLFSVGVGLMVFAVLMKVETSVRG